MGEPAPTNAQLATLLGSLATQVADLAAAVSSSTSSAGSGTSSVSFALTPGQIKSQAVINYAVKQGSAQWEAGIKSLHTPFNLTSDHLTVFINELKSRSVAQGWDQGTNDLFTFNDNAGEEVNLITQYGLLTSELIETQTEDLLGTGSNVATRKAQNNMQAQTCLMNTLGPKAKALLLTHREDYTKSSTDATGAEQSTIVAALMLKTMLKIATVDSKATTKILRSNLNHLPEAMVMVKGDIDLFHKYVYENVAQLHGRGEKCNDLVQCLFDAYRQAPDTEFVRYMTNLEDDYQNDHNDMGDIADVDLRTKAEGKFNTLRTLKTWGAKSPADQKIIAMSSEISSLRGKLALAGKASHKPKSAKKGAAAAAGGGGKVKNKKSGFNKSQQKEDEKWKKIPPKEGESSTKTVKGKPWTWCVHHMAWGNHSANECRMGKKRQQEQMVANSAAASDTVGASASPSASSSIYEGLSYMATIASVAARDE